MTRRTKIAAIVMITSILFMGCMQEDVPPEEAAADWEEQARTYEEASEWEEAAKAWGEAAEAWEKQADIWEDAGDMRQASEAREEAARDLEASAEAYGEAYEWKKAVKAYERAAEVWEMAAESWEAYGIQKSEDCLGGVAGCWFNIGKIYDIWLLDRGKAVEAYEKAAEIFETIGSDTLAELCREWASEASEPEADAESEFEEAEMIILESQQLHNDGSVEVCMLNAGSNPVVIDVEYKNGIPVEGASHHEIPINSTVCFTLAGTYAPGDDAILVTEEGTIIKFTIEESSSFCLILI